MKDRVVYVRHCSKLDNFNYKPQAESRQQHLALYTDRYLYSISIRLALYTDRHLRLLAIMIEVTSR